MSIRMNEYREQFLAEGEAIGEAKERTRMAESTAELVMQGKLSYDIALAVLGMTEEEFSVYCTRPQTDSL